MLYTRKGDGGETGTFRCDQRMMKSSFLAEALGTVDETNAFLGVCKMEAGETEGVAGVSIAEMVDRIQQDLFIVQAELAGAEKAVTQHEVDRIEGWTDAIEGMLPPIHSFFVSGGTTCAAMFDVARTIARRAERRVVAVSEEGSIGSHPHLLAYMNRLSSILYALARLANHRAGVGEEAPTYEKIGNTAP